MLSLTTEIKKQKIGLVDADFYSIIILLICFHGRQVKS
jgi:hypothetical protein